MGLSDWTCFKCHEGYHQSTPPGTCIRSTPEIRYCHYSCASSGMPDTDLVDFVNCIGPGKYDCLKCTVGKWNPKFTVCEECEGLGVQSCEIDVEPKFRPGYFGPLATGIHPTPSYSDPPRSLSTTVPWMHQCQHLHHLRSKKQYYTRLPNLQNA